MLLIDTILICQALLGAFDNLWHHEWQARLPQQRVRVDLHVMRAGLLDDGIAILFGIDQHVERWREAA